MKFFELPLKGAFRIELEKREDERGYFARSFCAKEFSEHGLPQKFVQRNFSFSKSIGTLRGMHFQVSPHAEDKLVACHAGKIFDVLVDLRESSPTYLKWYGEVLSSEEMNMLLIPKGFAHGFQTLEDNSLVSYLVSEFYNPEAERGLRWDDPKIKIAWPEQKKRIFSERDLKHPLLR